MPDGSIQQVFEGVPGEANRATSSTERFYEERASEYFSLTFDADTAAPRDRFLSRLPQQARILDAGCGSGRDLRAFVERGYAAVGIDASAALVRLAQDYAGAECKVLRLENIDYESAFEGVWACASLLHLPRTMLVPVLTRLHRALVRGGTLFLAVQEGRGELRIEDGRDYVYYSSAEVGDALQAAGFLIDEIWLTGDAGDASHLPVWINVLAMAN